MGDYPAALGYYPSQVALGLPSCLPAPGHPHPARPGRLPGVTHWQLETVSTVGRAGWGTTPGPALASGTNHRRRVHPPPAVHPTPSSACGGRWGLPRPSRPGEDPHPGRGPGVSEGQGPHSMEALEPPALPCMENLCLCRGSQEQ